MLRGLAKALNPVRLPYELERRIKEDPTKDVKKWRVILTVHGLVDHELKERTLKPMSWDDRFALGDREMKVNAAKPREERAGAGGPGGYQSKLGAFGGPRQTRPRRPRGRSHVSRLSGASR